MSDDASDKKNPEFFKKLALQTEDTKSPRLAPKIA
jgi:hypothetical protein